MSQVRAILLALKGFRNTFPEMQVFFRSEKEIELFLSRLKLIRCQFCGQAETMVRHGFVRGCVSNKKRGIRRWRIRCKKSHENNGCGKTPSVCLGGTLPRRWLNTKQLLTFIRALCEYRSIKAAWEHWHIGLTLDSGYRIYKRLCACQSILRTRLCSRAPPPESKTGVPLFQVFAHLKEEFGNTDPIRTYQEHFQRSFLAIA
jgi:hypothetical protein